MDKLIHLTLKVHQFLKFDRNDTTKFARFALGVPCPSHTNY